MLSSVEVDDLFQEATRPLQSFIKICADILPAGVECSLPAMGDVLEALLRDATDLFRTRLIQATPTPEEPTS